MKKEILDTLIALVKIESKQEPAEPNAPFGKSPRKALDYMLSLGKKLGFAVDDADGYAGAIEFGEGAETVGILAHLDVIPFGTGWTRGQGEIADGILYGRGVVDDKGPAVLCLYAMKEIMDSGAPLSRRVRLILGCNEESGNRCMDYYRKVRKMPDVGFSPDADFPVITYEKEIGWLRLTVPVSSEFKRAVVKIDGGVRPNVVPNSAALTLRGGEVITFGGRSAHGMEPHKGDNALFKLVKHVLGLGVKDENFSAIAEYIANTDNLNRLGINVSDPSSGAQTLNLGKMEFDGGDIIMTLDARCPRTQTVADLQRRILGKLPEGSRFEVIYNEPALCADPDSFLVRTLKEVYTRNTGEAARGLIIGGGTYARKMPNCVAFGCMYEGQSCNIHDADEFIPLAQLEKVYDIYRDAILELAKQEIV
ncbi:MAG: Sapep family Mn(2+)-dependent dipeptidase [Clostridiales bacterium]|nr:Sapep family Mn(2+)-dependent dipeptidase [Clostridiales bacterium]